LLRSLGGVAGVAVPTAVLDAVTAAALKGKVPSQILAGVFDGSWRIGDIGSPEIVAEVLAVRMHGFRVVFMIFAPLMAVCLLASSFAADIKLQGDGDKNEEKSEKGRRNKKARWRVDYLPLHDLGMGEKRIAFDGGEGLVSGFVRYW